MFLLIFIRSFVEIMVILIVKFVSQIKLDHHLKTGRAGRPFRPSIGPPSSVHPRSRPWDLQASVPIDWYVSFKWKSIQHNSHTDAYRHYSLLYHYILSLFTDWLYVKKNGSLMIIINKFVPFAHIMRDELIRTWIAAKK